MDERPKILIVDDRVENLIALEKVLSGLEVEPVRALSGNEALALMLENDFALALVDVQMPDMDGYETVKLMRQEKKNEHLPVIFISAVFSDEYYQVKGIETGAIDFITKPFNPKILLGKVTMHLELYKQRIALKYSYDHMEALVEERTAEILQANEFLKAEIQEREKAEEFINSIFQHMREGLVVLDRDFNILKANTAYCEYHNISPKDILNYHCYEISHSQNKPCYDLGEKCPVRYSFETGEPLRVVHAHNKADGSVAFMEIKSCPLKNENGKVISVIETMNDITEKKKAEEELKETLMRYHLIFDEAKDGIVIIDSETGRISNCNREFQIQTGMNIEQLKNMHIWDLRPEAKREAAKTKFIEIGESGEGNSSELEFQRPDGEIVFVDFKTKKINIKDHDYLLSIVRDISDKKILEAQLLQAQKMEAVGQLTGGIAHDFNNILNVIIGFSNLMEMKIRADDPLRNDLNEIIQASDRATALTHSLLAFSRHQVIRTEPVNLNNIVVSIEKILSRLIGEDIELKTNMKEQEIFVLADAGQIEQVLMNLATNARDAMPNGGMLVMETQTIELDESFIKAHGYGVPGRYGLILVTDTGEGMNEETQKHIFNPFFTTKQIGKGTGLGLSMVYGIIKQHEGFINVYSELGKGTTFKIYLPISILESENRTEISAKTETALTGGTETILVAEDDDSLRKLSRTVLKQKGYEVIDAVDGEDAIKKFKENKDKVQLVILDLMMPKKNGKEAYQEISKIQPDIKAIFVSGYTEDMMKKENVIKEGMSFILKPVSPIALLKKVRDVLDK